MSKLDLDKIRAVTDALYNVGGPDDRFTTALGMLMDTIAKLPESRRAAGLKYATLNLDLLKDGDFDSAATAKLITNSSDEIIEQLKAEATKTDLPKKDQFH